LLMLLRDRLLARMAEMGPHPDHQRLAAEVLGIRNAPPDLARRLVSQALVIEDRREAWREIGEGICAQAPGRPGVYVLRDAGGTALYVGKANNLRRRLGAHFAGRQWRGLKAPLARVAAAEWQEVGSELEALLREAALIRELAPIVNTQTGPPALETRQLTPALVRDVIVVLPSIEEDSAELVAARPDGAWFMQRTRRSGADLAVHARRLMRFFRNPTIPARVAARRNDGLRLAPIVFSWLGGRGAGASRLDPRDAVSSRELQTRLGTLLADEGLFAERIVVINSKFRTTPKRP
jgi:predicted GIY-YIG superfamily endonuclease